MIVIGHIALIQRSKKQDIVFETAKILKQRGHNVIVIFAGECRDDDFLEELKKTTKETEMSDSVLFLGRRTDIPDLLKLIDVLMIPSSFEGFPLAGLEASAAGVPVVACDIGGAKEFVEVSRGGSLFRFDDPEDAANQVEICMKDRTTLSGNGAVFADSCGLPNYKEKIISAFSKI